MSTWQRFWVSLILALPMFVQMLLMPFHLMLPYNRELAFVTTTAIMAIAAWPYWKSAYAAFLMHHANMNTLVSLGTGITYLYSVFALLTDRAVYFESAAFVMVFVLLGDALEERMHYNASNALSKLLDLQAKTALVLKNGQYVEIPLQDVQVGDQLLVKPGQKVPVDGKIIDGVTTIDESMVTGESMPTRKQVGDQVIGATINQNGSFVLLAEKIGQDTLLSQIVELVKKAQTSHAPIQKVTDQVANVFVPAVLILAILTFVTWYSLLSASFVQAMLYAVSVIVIACPCALGLATPTALMVGTAKSAKSGILIKNGEVLQKVAELDTVVFDKTGTITVGQPEVTDIIGDEQVLKLAASLEHLAQHPLALAIINQAQARKVKLAQVSDFESIAGFGVCGKIGKDQIYVGRPTKLPKNELAKFALPAKKLTEQGKTVVWVAKNFVAMGLLAIQDAPKPTSKLAIANLKAKGLTTVMLTGDNQAVAQNIAEQVGIDQVIANVLPTQKAAEIEQLKKTQTVAFVGDGINDAPALSSADVGIAMGSGTDIAIESGGIVLFTNDLLSVDKAILISKKTFNRIKLNLFWAFIYNLIGIPIAAGIFSFVGLNLTPELAGLAMAFSSVSVVSSSLLLNKIKI